MLSTSSFVGPFDQSPLAIKVLLGSLLPVVEGAAVTVVYVPAGAQFHGEEILLAEPTTHLLIVVESTAGAEIMLKITGGGERRHGTEILVQDGATCAVTVLQDCNSNADLTVREEAQLGSDATLTWTVRAFGEGNSDHTLRSVVAGRNARSDVLWTCSAKGKEKRAIRAENVFQAPQGRGEMTLKAIAQHHASVRALGKITIGEHGGGTDTYLTQDVLMLDATAHVDAVPALEIKTNDVKASHSASIRRITPEDLFYFGARGIAVEEARDLFIRGFLGMAEPDVFEIE